MLKRNKEWSLSVIFILAFFCTGIFREYVSCVFCVLVIGYLFVRVRKNKQFIFYQNLTTLFVVILLLFYLFTCLWAIDSGMAFIGFIKFLPIGLFVIVLMQEDMRERLLGLLPYIAVIMVLISAIGSLIPILKPYVSVAGRWAGMFQYPNTFALFLLIAELLLLDKKKKWKEIIMISIIMFGLLMTGSRTVFVLAVLSNLAFVICHKNKKIRYLGISIIIIAIVGIAVYAFLFHKGDAITRLLRISLTESTFVGRILYFKDALPLILRNPLGLGYTGHYYLQQSIQTGLYSVRFIHNDFLQILLDVGWIPGILFVVAIVKSLMNPNGNWHRKLILVVMCLHSCFDFNLQFVAMFCLIILFLDYDMGKKKIIRKQIGYLNGGAVILACMCIYMGSALALEASGNYSASLKVYPWNTIAATEYLKEVDDLETASTVADRILTRNGYVTIAQSVKSRQAYANGDFGNVIAYKNDLLNKAPYQYDEYEEYCRMLMNGIILYQKSGDKESAQICKDELMAIPSKLKQAEGKISKLGKMIKDQPVTELPNEIQTYIKQLENEK